MMGIDLTKYYRENQTQLSDKRIEELIREYLLENNTSHTKKV